MSLIIHTRHRSHSNDGNKNSAFPGYIKQMADYRGTTTSDTGKYDNIVKGWYFRCDGDNKMSFR